jgi:hypothetical protein
VAAEAPQGSLLATAAPASADAAPGIPQGSIDPPTVLGGGGGCASEEAEAAAPASGTVPPVAVGLPKSKSSRSFEGLVFCWSSDLKDKKQKISVKDCPALPDEHSRTRKRYLHSGKPPLLRRFFARACHPSPLPEMLYTVRHSTMLLAQGPGRASSTYSVCLDFSNAIFSLMSSDLPLVSSVSASSLDIARASCNCSSSSPAVCGLAASISGFCGSQSAPGCAGTAVSKRSRV